MEIVESRRKLVFVPHDADAIIKFIPHAKAFMVDGHEFVAVDHGVEETIVLRNMGLQNPPAPILSYYDWPGRVPAMSHQKETAAFLTLHKQALCLNSPGTGKTLSALWAADSLLEQGVIKTVGVIAPLSTLQPVWGKELKHHLPHRNFRILTGTRERRLRLLEEPPVPFYIINHDGFTSLKNKLKFDLVIYDEVTALKTPSSQRYRVFQTWSNENNPWLWMLTGTPISQAPIDAWTLARLARSSSIPRSFTQFRDMVMRKVTTFRWEPREEAMEICKQVLQPSIRFALDECVDLPDMVYVARSTELTVAQQRAYKDMEETAVALFSKGTVVAANAAVVLGKMIQICCGVIYSNNGEYIHIADNFRYESLKELLNEIGDKVIVFIPLRGVQEKLHAQLQADGYDVASVHGEVTGRNRNDIFYNFQNTASPKILLAHPKVAAHGLDLTRAASVIWYAPIYSLEQYEQANARIRRLTSRGRTTIFHLYATPLEKELYRRLQQKKQVLADFLKLVKGINEDD